MSKITKQFEVFDGLLTLAAECPGTAAEWDEVVGTDGACLEAAITQLLWHVHAGTVRRTVVAALTKAGHKRAESGKTNKAGNAVLESEDAFVQRLVKDGAITKEEFVAVAEKALADENITFESTMKNRGRARASIGQNYLDDAQDLVEGWERGTTKHGKPTSVESSLAKIRQWVPDAQIADPTDVESVARLLREVDKAKKDESYA